MREAMLREGADAAVTRSTLLRVPFVTRRDAIAQAAVRECIDQWIRSKAAEFDVSWDGGAITNPRLLVEVADDADSARYALSLWHRDSRDERRAWTVEVATTPLGMGVESAVEIDVRLTCSHDPQDRGILASVPRFVREIADQVGIVDAGRKLTPTPLQIVDTEESVAAFVRLVQNQARTLPVLAISEPEVVSVEEIASTLYPLAHVARVTGGATYRITDAYGRASSLFGGAVRLYPTGWDMANPPHERVGLFWLADHIRYGRIPFTVIATRRVATELAALHESRQLVSPRSLVGEIARRDTDRLRATAAAEREAQGTAVSQAPAATEIEHEQHNEIARLRDDNELLERQLAQARDDAAKARREAEEWEGLASAYERERDEVRARLVALGSGQAASLTAGLSEQNGEIISMLFNAVRAVRDRFIMDDGIAHDRDAVRSENDELRRALFTLRAQHGNGVVSAAAPEGASSGSLPIGSHPENWRDFDALEGYVRLYYGERLVLHPRVRRTITDGDPANVDGLFEVLDALGTDYCASKHGDRDAYARFTERVKPYKYGKAVTDSGAGVNREEYEVEWYGRVISPENILHVRERGRDFAGRKFALYFFYDEEREQVVITAMPRHRWTANART